MLKNGLSSAHAMPRMVCLYRTVTSRSTRKYSRSRYSRHSRKSINFQVALGSMTTVGRVGDRRWELEDVLSPIFDLRSSVPMPSSICDLPSSIASVLSSIFHLPSSICRLPRGGRTGGCWAQFRPVGDLMNRRTRGPDHARQPFSDRL